MFGSTRPKPAGRTVENPKSSLPVKSCSTVALERENTECPEKYPGNDGVRLLPGLYGDHFSPVDLLDRPSRAAPRVEGLSLLREADCRDRAHPVVLALDVPGHDACVERRVVHREEHLGVLIDRVVVAL